MTDLSLTVERTIAAPQDKVFQAWLDPEMMKKFMLAGPGMSVPSASVDAREGGTFQLVMKMADTEIPHSGTYKEISPHERIVFTWVSPYSADGSEVTLTFAPKNGGTHVTLTHVRFVDEESRANHEGGWSRILETLDGVLS